MKGIKPLTIGQVAKQAGVGVETIRFYERKRLIDQPQGKEAGYRHYPQEVIGRIKFIKNAKELGFSLKEISELLNLRIDPATTCADVRKKAMDKINDVEAKIGELENIKKALTELASICVGSGPTSECPILDAFEKQRD